MLYTQTKITVALNKDFHLSLLILRSTYH